MSEYSFVSVPKQSNNQGMPSGKKNVVLLFDFDKVTEYERDEKGVQITKFKPAALAGLFVNEGTIDAGDNAEGDAYEKGFVHHVNFQHPGTDLEFAEFKANNINASLGAVVVPCDPQKKTAKVYGTPCAPLHFNDANEEDTAEANRHTVALQTALRTYPVGVIAKSLLPKTDNDAINAALGLTGVAEAGV